MTDSFDPEERNTSDGRQEAQAPSRPMVGQETHV